MPSMRETVSKDSIRPIAAKIKACGRMIQSVSKLSGTSGTLNVGRLPEMLARSPTVGVLIPPKITTAETIRIAASAEGNFEVTYGIR